MEAFDVEPHFIDELCAIDPWCDGHNLYVDAMFEKDEDIFGRASRLMVYFMRWMVLGDLLGEGVPLSALCDSSCCCWP